MATYTDNYALIKPTMSELADIRTINGNMDTIDEIMHGSQVSIADAYDPTQTYDVDDLVMYGFLLYKCITAVTTPEAFDANKWTRSTAIGEIPTDTFTGATSQTAGSKGLVPAPSAGDQNKFLKANGTWDTPAGGGGGGGIDYSTTEQNTGLKWIDGKDVYQIVISDTMPTAVTEGTTVMKQVSAVSNVDTIVSMVAVIYNGNSTSYIQLPYITDSGSSAKIQYDVTNGYLKLYSSVLSFNGLDVNVIMQYTKSTS